MDYEFENEWIKLTIKDCPSVTINNLDIHDELTGFFRELEEFLNDPKTHFKKELQTMGQKWAGLFMMFIAFGMHNSLEQLREIKKSPPGRFFPRDN